MLDLRQNLDFELNQITSFIREALNQAPTFLEIDSESEEKETLILERNLDQLTFANIPEIQFSGKVASVDGGSASLLSGRSFLVGAFRAGYTIFAKNQRIEEQVGPLQFALVTRANKEELYTQVYHNLTGQAPSQTPEMDKILDRLRLFAEWTLATELLDRLEPGDVLLLDGSLRATVAIPDNFLEVITKKASERGIILVGISKSTTLYWGDKSPLLSAVVKKAQQSGVDRAWYSKIGDLKRELKQSHWFGTVYIAKFKEASDFAFRVDVNRLEEQSEDKTFGILSALSSDPAFLGYPYPLAATHILVRITPPEIEDLRHRLQRKALESGISESDWDLLFKDFHLILNADLNR